MIRSRRRIGERGRRFRRRIDERGEALPAAILFVGVIFTVLIGVHVVLIALARTAVQSAAEAAVVAAQSAGSGTDECDGDTTTTETARLCEGMRGARRAMAASGSSITETQPAEIDVQADRGFVRVRVWGGTISPVLGGLELTAQSCGPLEDVPALELTGTGAWEC